MNFARNERVDSFASFAKERGFDRTGGLRPRGDYSGLDGLLDGGSDEALAGSAPLGLPTVATLSTLNLL